jgi:ligand-binding sensor domain-containing protein
MLKLKLAVLCFLIYIKISAQSQYKYTHFSTDDGLPTNTIYAITEDKNGNLVLGTDNGLSIFNGNDFKTISVSKT